MATVLDVIKERRSIRDFRKGDVPEEIIGRLIDAIVWAPSAGNLQSRKFYFVKDAGIKRSLAAAALNQRFIADAPLAVVGCADTRIGRRYGERGAELYAIQDVACSIMNMMLVAAESGLGTVWVGAFREGEVSEILHLPDYLRPVAIVPVGHPSRTPSVPPRIPVKEAVEFR